MMHAAEMLLFEHGVVRSTAARERAHVQNKRMNDILGREVLTSSAKHITHTHT